MFEPMGALFSYRGHNEAIAHQTLLAELTPTNCLLNKSTISLINCTTAQVFYGVAAADTCLRSLARQDQAEDG